MFSGSDHLNQYNVQTVHILIGDVLHDIVHQPQPQMLAAFLADVRIGHLARQKRVEGLPPVFQCHAGYLVVRIDMNIKRMMDDMPVRVFGNVGHEFLTTQITLVPRHPRCPPLILNRYNWKLTSHIERRMLYAHPDSRCCIPPRQKLNDL